MSGSGASGNKFRMSVCTVSPHDDNVINEVMENEKF